MMCSKRKLYLGSETGVVGYKTVTNFTANVNSFTDSNKNYKRMQTGRFWHMCGERCPTKNSTQNNNFELKIIIK
jgi:hypothetical protein